MEPLLSIIIPTHNSESTIQRCINSLTSQSFPREQFEIIVVDDGSKDKTTNLAKNAGADQIIVTNPCSLGKARNIAVQKTKSNLLAFIDSDCEAEDGYVKTIINELQNHQAIGGPVLNGNPQSIIAWGEYFVEFCAFHEYRKRSTIRTIPGCNISCTKDAFFKVGGFTDMRLSEDIMFAACLRLSGIDQVFVPEVQIRHLCRTQLNKVLANQKLLGKYFVRNLENVPGTKSRLLKKNRWVIPLLFIGKIGKSANYALKAKKISKFILAFPIIFLANISSARGFWEEVGKKSKTNR